MISSQTFNIESYIKVFDENSVDIYYLTISPAKKELVLGYHK